MKFRGCDEWLTLERQTNVEITEVKVKLIESKADRLLAFCSITFDNSFVVRDLKIIEGANGPFVAMPSRKVMERCPACGAKNHVRSRYCNECGASLNNNKNNKRTKLHADIAHPINSECREIIQKKVLDAFAVEKEKLARGETTVAKDMDDIDDSDASGAN